MCKVVKFYYHYNSKWHTREKERTNIFSKKLLELFIFDLISLKCTKIIFHFLSDMIICEAIDNT